VKEYCHGTPVFRVVDTGVPNARHITGILGQAGRKSSARAELQCRAVLGLQPQRNAAAVEQSVHLVRDLDRVVNVLFGHQRREPAGLRGLDLRPV
jgi:hypothetical protein